MNTGIIGNNILRGETAAELLDESGITPDKAVMFCGKKAHALPAVRELVRMSGKPFLLVGTVKELEDSCLWTLNPDWISKRGAACPDDGSGVLMLTLDTDIGQTLAENPNLWENRYVILCLGSLQADRTVQNLLSILGGYIILAPLAYIITRENKTRTV